MSSIELIEEEGKAWAVIGPTGVLVEFDEAECRKVAAEWIAGNKDDIYAYAAITITVLDAERARCEKECEAISLEYEDYTVHDEWPDPQIVIDKCIAAIQALAKPEGGA